MSFPSRWQFDPGTTLAITLEICGTRDRVRVEGVVVGCEKTAERMWSVTLLFLETPAGLGIIRKSEHEIRADLSGTPVAPGHSPA